MASICLPLASRRFFAMPSTTGWQSLGNSLIVSSVALLEP